MIFIDTHAHLQWPDYQNNLDDIFKRAFEAKVTKMIVVGTEIKNLEKALALAETKDFLWASVGVHPHDVKDIHEPQDLNFIKDKAQHKKVVAIGEIGLDYFYEHSDRELQKKYFAKQIQIAIDAKKPLIVHSRKAPDDTIDILREEKASTVNGVAHCFTEELPFAKKLIDFGFYISFTGIITFKKKVDYLHDVVRYVPLERMLLETDCPYLTPEPYRGKTNEPAYLRLTALKIAELKNVTLEEVANITTANAQKLFGI